MFAMLTLFATETVSENPLSTEYCVTPSENEDGILASQNHTLAAEKIKKENK